MTEIIKTRPIVSVVMLMHNISPWLLECSKQCFRSLVEHTVYPACEFIVVDNASTTQGWQEFNKYLVGQGAVVVRHEKNLGMTGGFNSGLEMSSGDYIFFVENDVVVTDFWVTNALALFSKNPKCGLIKAVEDNKLRDETRTAESYNQEERYKEIQDSNKAWMKEYLDSPESDLDGNSLDAWFSLWCFAIRREVLDTIDGYLFDEKIGLNWDEDMDICWRLRDAGWKMYQLYGMYVFHKAAQTCCLKGEYAASPEKEKGRRYFTKKHDIILSEHGWPTRRKFRKEQEVLGHTYKEYEDVHGVYIEGKGQRVI